MRWYLLSFLLVATAASAGAQDSTLKEYVGTYIFPDGSFVPSAEITLRDTVLSVTSVQGSSDLLKKSKDTFNFVSYNGMAYFKRDSTTGNVNGIKVDVESILLEGQKELSSALLPPRSPLAKPKRPLTK